MDKESFKKIFYSWWFWGVMFMIVAFIFILIGNLAKEKPKPLKEIEIPYIPKKEEAPPKPILKEKPSEEEIKELQEKLKDLQKNWEETVKTLPPIKPPPSLPSLPPLPD